MVRRQGMQGSMDTERWDPDATFGAAGKPCKNVLASAGNFLSITCRQLSSSAVLMSATAVHNNLLQLTRWHAATGAGLADRQRAGLYDLGAPVAPAAPATAASPRQQHRLAERFEHRRGRSKQVHTCAALRNTSDVEHVCVCGSPVMLPISAHGQNTIAAVEGRCAA